jgi:hypothetical protein
VPLTGIIRHVFVPVPSQNMDLQRHMSWLFSLSLSLSLSQSLLFNGLKFEVIILVLLILVELLTLSVHNNNNKAHNTFIRQNEHNLMSAPFTCNRTGIFQEVCVRLCPTKLFPWIAKFSVCILARNICNKQIYLLLTFVNLC